MFAPGQLRGAVQAERSFLATLGGGCNVPLGAHAVPTEGGLELTGFVGRDDEVAAVGELVNGERMVSLVGVGGVGKTRLAMEAAGRVADEFADGVWFASASDVLPPSSADRAALAALRTRGTVEGVVRLPAVPPSSGHT